jgi:hypothetical protein
VDPARLASAALSTPVRIRGTEELRDRETLGRSRAGLTSKIHLLADSRCRPLARVTSSGHRHDSLGFLPLMSRLKIARRVRGGAGPGRSGCWMTRLIPAARSALTCAAAGSGPPSPSPRTRSRTGVTATAGAAARPPSTRVAYNQRNTVEQVFWQLRRHHAVATRYDEPDYIWRGDHRRGPRSGPGSATPSHDL